MDPPERHCKALLGKADFPHLPALNGIARQPYLRPDGSLQAETGYDEVSGMYGAFEAPTFSVPANPTKHEALAALEVLTVLLSEFAFRNDPDLSAAVSAILTAAVRPNLEQAPMIHVRAP